jgi:uncharacterized caspase-like protein
LGEEATLSQLKYNAGDWLVSNAKPDDSVIIYFAGHGAEELLNNSEKKTTNYLLPFDSQAKSFYSSAFSLADDLPILLNRIGCEHVTVILDCCFSGAGNSKSVRGVDGHHLRLQRLHSVADMKSKVLLRNNINLDIGIGRVLLLACGPNQFALETSRFQNGIFTHFFIQALAKSNSRGYISSAVLHDQVANKVFEFTNGLQNPIMEGRIQRHRLVSFN